MARRHSRDKGKSKSKKPINKEIPSWVRYSEKEVEAIVVKLAKEDLTPSMIGLKLRDIYGVPDCKVITKKSITQILAENKMLAELPEDFKALLVKLNNVKKHMETNNHDMGAKRGYQLTESKILAMVKYYKRVGKLPPTWKYDPKRVNLLVQ